MTAREMSIKQEARLLSVRTGLRVEACEKWMRSVGINSVLDLMRRYPGASHADCLQRAASEIETFILST